MHAQLHKRKKIVSIVSTKVVAPFPLQIYSMILEVYHESNPMCISSKSAFDLFKLNIIFFNHIGMTTKGAKNIHEHTRKNEKISLLLLFEIQKDNDISNQIP